MAGEAIVLLHGFTQTGASWRSVSARLAERYRLTAPDLRGHGDAGDARPVSFAAVLDDLAALVPTGATLAGYSMGGRIALAFALAHPGLLARLVLVSASPGIADLAERAARRAADERLAHEIEGDDLAAFARRWASQPLFSGQSADVARLAHEDRLRNTPAGLAAALRGLGTGVMVPCWDRLATLELSVSLVVGARDEKFCAIAARMARLLPRATLEVVAGAGHAVHLEAPDAVARALS